MTLRPNEILLDYCTQKLAKLSFPDRDMENALDSATLIRKSVWSDCISKQAQFPAVSYKKLGENSILYRIIEKYIRNKQISKFNEGYLEHMKSACFLISVYRVYSTFCSLLNTYLKEFSRKLHVYQDSPSLHVIY